MLISAASPEAPVQLPPQVQQAMLQKDQALAASQAQIAELNKAVVQLQQALYELQDDSKAKILMKQMDIASEEKIALWKIQAEAGQLNVELATEAQMERDKMMLDLVKEREQTRREAMSVQTPLFTTSKFTS